MRVLKGIGAFVGGLLLVLAATLGWWALRPNRAAVDPSVVSDSWAAVSDGAHNSNTDLIYWQDAFYLIHATSPWHFASERSRLIVWRSTDAVHWERLAELGVEGQDIRDPHFAVVGDRLFLYALKNTAFTAEPYGTVLSVSEDGRHWTPFQDLEPQGWLFWQPKTADGQTWYAPAYWREHGRSILLRSTDGERWTEVGLIHEGDRNDETAIEFLPDGRLLCTARLEGSDSILGDPRAATLIGTAPPPYTDWSTTRSYVTRLDGPALFSYRGRVYAVGRYQPGPRGPLTRLGSIFSRKRTALFLVREDGLVWLTDLPSAGDTSYAGAVVQGDTLYVSYYTSPIGRDYPWILGMLSPSEIRIARVSLPDLERLAGQAGE